MRSFIIGSILVAGALAAVPAAAIVTIGTACDPAGPSFALTVAVFNQFVEGDPAGYGIVLEQTWVGSCEPPTVIATPPMPLPPFAQEVQFAFSVAAPALAQKFLYVPRLKHPDGSLEVIPLRYGDVLAIGIAECFAGPAVRGYLRSDLEGLYRVQACDVDCGTWLCYDGIDLSGVDQAAWLPYLGSGIALDIEGWRPLAPMPGTPCLFATAVRPTAGNDCAPVPEAPATWSSLKADYR